MNETVKSAAGTRHPSQNGPPLGILAIVSVVLLLTGLATSAALGGVFPSPFGDAAAIGAYFRDNSGAVRADGFFLVASSVPLALFAATASARLRRLGVTAPGATIGLVGGVLASGMLAMSGLLASTLARPGVRGVDNLVPGLQYLAFLTGGVAHVIFLGLLIAGIAVPGLVLQLLPRSLAISGLVVAGVCEVSSVSLLAPALSVLVPVGRFPGLAWLIAAGLLLPRHRSLSPTSR